MERVIVITGASRGLGRAIARSFAKEGPTILFISYHSDRCAAEAVAAELVDTTCKVHVRKLALEEPESISAFFASVGEVCGRIDVLVNNAGMNVTNDFDKQTIDEWQAVLAVNLTGVFLSCQSALPWITEEGRIINIGSVSGQLGGPRSPAYAAAKCGLIGLTHCLARFLASKRVTVNCVSPGIIDSDMTNETMPPVLRAKRLQNILIGRLASHQEVASAVVYLASRNAAFITAQTINVNGGEWW